MPSANSFTTSKCIIMLLLLVARSVTSFLPASTPLSLRTTSTTTAGMIRRRLHYNSLWVQRQQQQRSASRPLQQTEAAESEDDSSNSRTATGNISNTNDDDDDSSSTNDTSNDPWASYRNRNNIRDQVVSAISKQGGIKVTACTIRNSVNDIMMQHTMTDVATQAMGRTLSCALLMSNGMQEEQTVQISLNCKYGKVLSI